MDNATQAARRAIVTASDSGIGKATAIALAAQGLDVGITWHTDEAGAQQTADEVRSHGRQAFVARLDTSDVPGCADVVDTLADQLGGLDVFVNNAGTGDGTLLVDLAWEDWRHVVAVDLERPTSAAEGGQVAAPVFADILRFALTADGVVPSGTARPDFTITPGS